MFFFKQKTAYEMRISDWSSDVCSSDLLWCELRWNLQSRTQISRRVSGVGTVLMLVALAGGVGAVLQYGLLVLAGPWAWPLIALLAVAGLAQRSLYDHVAPVALALEAGAVPAARSEEQTSELQSIMRLSYAVFCLKKKK